MTAVATGGTTSHCHESSAAIDEAAAWLAGQTSLPSPIIPELQRRFGLTIVDACAAAREAGLVRGRAH